MNLSRRVESAQTAPHPRLAETVAKHAASPWLKPVADRSRLAFEALAAVARGRRLVLDSGCGTGRSTAVLAARYAGCLAIGIDKSPARLDKVPLLPENALVARLDLEDFWRLALAAGWTFERQCFYYPNPWPKPEQRLRRWPFHPVFPTVLACGGVLELRTNWKVYAEEFAVAVGLLTGITPEVERWRPPVPETPFETKYLASGHELWRCETASGGIPAKGR
jgi:tRNA (guanine-N7-)-methyltransferase